MDSALNAHRWGIKAAQADLPITSNPYRTPHARAAWLAGYRQGAESLKMALPD